MQLKFNISSVALMLLHKYQAESSILYTLFDVDEKVVVYPTSYLRALRRNKRPSESQRQIAYVLKKYCQWLEENFEGISVDEILKLATGDDIVEWINDQRAIGISEATIHNREVLTREMYRWLTTADGGRLIKDAPWGEKTFSKNQHKRLPRFVTMEQVITLLKGLHNESQRVAVHFLFDTGVRVSELTRLTNNLLPNESDWPKDVNYYPLKVPGSKPYDGSKYKYRYTIISRPVLARVRRYHSSQEYTLSKWRIYDPYKPTFLTVHGEALTVDSVQQSINAAWIRQGRNHKEISPHRLRHGTAYSVLQSEFGKELLDNLLILKSMLGHERINTTEIYTSIPIAALRSIGGKQQIRFKYEEAQQIYDATYLPARMHKERRGHSK
jgi:integrase/recombinase XerD